MTTAQAMATRRRARQDPRFKKQKSADAETTKRRLEAKINRERDRATRSRKMK